ncbi:hypothetical protein BDV36DRAFT_254522 [Aspergillus pseudocaelatus]|uniref:Uncharacterized protein n=1 Tax=Aspergillus pseudocaelatus TaxID=1825620 RepID=A0ABQ6WMF1_9EURO|nr:hypothetical protein BDV36DRAFT_254522 [Aspergillus pseudocaelatus]
MPVTFTPASNNLLNLMQGNNVLFRSLDFSQKGNSFVVSYVIIFFSLPFLSYEPLG